MKEQDERLEVNADRAENRAGDRSKVNPIKSKLAKPEAVEAEADIPGAPTTHERPSYNPTGNKPPRREEKE